MAVYLKWHMCPCHEPLVPHNSICLNTFVVVVIVVIAVREQKLSDSIACQCPGFGQTNWSSQ